MNNKLSFLVSVVVLALAPLGVFASDEGESNLYEACHMMCVEYHMDDLLDNFHAVGYLVGEGDITYEDALKAYLQRRHELKEERVLNGVWTEQQANRYEEETNNKEKQDFWLTLIEALAPGSEEELDVDDIDRALKDFAQAIGGYLDCRFTCTEEALYTI